MFEKYPYTDFHEMNLDWIIQEMKDLVDSWDSFGGSVTATAHEAASPEVTVSGDLKSGMAFDFGLVKGPKGNTGAQGPQGVQGPAGNGLEILDIYPDLASLQAAHPTGSPGDAYLVGSGGSYTLYIWSASASAWSDGGSLTSPAPGNVNPSMDGIAAPGTSTRYAREDHVHPSDTSKLDISANDGVYAVESGSQTMLGFANNSVPDALVQYDSTGAINASNVSVSANLSADTISVTDNTILNSSKLYGVANASNAYQPLTTVSANTPVLGIGEDLILQTPSVKFMGTKFANDGTSSDATSEVNFSSAFKVNDSDYQQSRIDLNPATAATLGGVKIGDGINVDATGTISAGVKVDLLWTNADTTQAFASQTINLDMSSYVLVLLEFKLDANQNTYSTSAISTIAGHTIRATSTDGYRRTFTARSTNMFFGIGLDSNGTNNEVMVPYRIYGIK